MKPFVLRRSDGTERTVSGYRKPGRPHHGATRYSGARLTAALPPRVDLRPNLTTIEDQGETSSCVANAVAGAYEYLVKQHLGDEAYDVSRLFIYYNARYLDEDYGEFTDGGSQIAKAIQGLTEYGACSEDTWPFDPESVNEEPGEDAYEEAAEFLVQDVELVPTDLDKWKRCLAEGYPIIFGISLFDSFDSQRKKGLVPLPSPREAARASHSGHAMLCVGYSDADQVFIVRNSWGPEWGDNGYCYIPYHYLLNTKYNDGDSWIIRRLDAIPDPQAQWDDSDESVIEDLDSEIAAMDDESYGALLDAMGDVPLETRIALLFLQAAGADGDLSDEELKETSEYLGHVLEAMGVDRSPDKVLRLAMRRVRDQKLLDQTVEILGEHLSRATLAGITAKLEEVVGTDDVSDEEQEFIDLLVEAWQVDGEEEEDEEEDAASEDES